MAEIDALISTARKLDPELWENVDRIARIIDPSAFGESWNGTGPEAEKREPGIRQQYMRSSAEHKAWMILQALGIAPEEFDWIEVFRAYAEEQEDGPSRETSDGHERMPEPATEYRGKLAHSRSTTDEPTGGEDGD